jgi:beta-N-acetylhexosaminidase
MASMSSRSLTRQVGRLLIGSFPGHTISPELRSLAREFDLGGIILFARNVQEPGQVAEISREAQELAHEYPLWVSVDQEGGRVARLRRPFTEWPPMAALGRSGDVGLAQRFARALAAEVKAVGISLDFAPVLDILTNPTNPAIGDRALADQADVVTRLGVAIIETLQAEGIAACGKHFPGHGDTSVDSHLELPVVEHDLARLRAVELVPFKAAIAARVAGILVSHVLMPALDEASPASLSRRIVHGLLREELGFEGLIVTDDLEMHAILNQYDLADAAVRSVAAGCDQVLVCRGDVDKQVRVLEALIQAVETEQLARGRVEDALRRQRLAKERFLVRWQPPQAAALRAVVGAPGHQAVAEEMARFL